MAPKKYRRILVLTDLTPGNVLFLMALSTQYPISEIILVMVGSSELARMKELATMLRFKKFFIATSSLDYEHIHDLIRSVDAVAAIRPPHELMGCKEVFKADFFLLGGDNILRLDQSDRQPPWVILRRCFPGKFVWVEPMDVLGENDAIEDIMLTGADVFDKLRLEWNASTRESCLRNISVLVHPPGKFHEMASLLAITKIARYAKLAERITRSPYQFTLNEYLVFMAMQDMYLRPGHLLRVDETGKSVFDTTVAERPFPDHNSIRCEMMRGEPHAIRKIAQTMIGSLLSLES